MVHKIVVLVPVLIAAIAVGTLGLLSVPPGVKNAPSGFPVGTVSINHDVIKVEVAKSSAEKAELLCRRKEKLQTVCGGTAMHPE